MNFFRTTFALCASFRNYRLVRDLPVTTSVKYLLKLLTLLAVLLMVSLVPWALKLGNQFASWVDTHFPPFSIQDGKIVAGDVKQPYTVGDADFLFILDTTGKITQPDAKSLQGVLFMADSFIVWMKTTNTADATLRAQRYPLRGFPDGAVNGDYFRGLFRSFLWVGLPLTLLVLVLIGLLSTLLQAYLFSLFASLIERGTPSGLQLPQLLNIAIHAVTPAAIVFTAYFAMRLQGLDLWLVYIVIYGIFLVGATNACRNRTAREESHDDDFL
ncbi:MAG TPA: DUF1189 family protein [Verrucomicrobiae bacterium]|nr:DUF1189 family protein [Verrucomicrobiae bacterium]